MTRLIALILALLAPPLLAQEAQPVAADAPATEAAPEPGSALAPIPAADVTLADYEWASRVLIVFADSDRQPQVDEQLRLLATDPAALAAREVVVLIDTDRASGSEARRELRPRGFAVVLLDLDGRVMLRRPAPQTMRELTRAIDRSPLRREETGYRGVTGR